MKRKKKTTIVTIESHERTTLRHSPRSLVVWCEGCSADVSMISPNEAAVVARTDARAIFRDIEAGEIHFLEDESGTVLVCSKSLARRFGSQT
jgi:hypothetical protein